MAFDVILQYCKITNIHYNKNIQGGIMNIIILIILFTFMLMFIPIPYNYIIAELVALVLLIKYNKRIV